MKKILFFILIFLWGKGNAQVIFPTTQDLTGTTFWVKTLDDLPTPVGNVITLVKDATYQISRKVDLQGNRIACSGVNTIVGSSSESQSLFSTGLDTAQYLITSDSSVSIKDLTINHNKAFNLVTTGADQVLDWVGVNVTNSTRSELSGYGNINLTGCAFLNSSNFILDGTVGTFAINYSFMDANVTPVFYFVPTFNGVRRVRIVYSAFVCTGTEGAFNWQGTIPDGQFIIKDCNFSGGGTYLVGISSLSPKATFHDNIGITNTLDFTNWDMLETDDFSGDYVDLTNKPTSFPPSAHTHAQAEVTGLVTDLANKQALLTGSEGIFSGWDKVASDDFGGAYSSLTGIPTSFNPVAHTHAQSEITGLVTDLGNKEPLITAGTTSEYLRGDKTFQALNATAVGLGNVNNTSDLNKPISTATQTALDGKFDEPVGTISQYIRGDGTLATFPSVTGESTTVTDSPTLDFTLTGTDITGSVVDGSITPTKLSQTYLTAEVDGSVTNEIQTLTLTGNALSISGGNSQTFTNWDVDDTDDFDGVYNSLTGIPTTFTPAVHTHTISNITNLQIALDNKQNTLGGGEIVFDNWDKDVTDDFGGAYASLTGIPATFAPSAHVHTQTDITGLVADLASKQPTLVGTETVFNGWDKNAADDFSSASPVGGDVTGTIGNIQLGAGSVTSTEISDGAVANVDFAPMPTLTVKANLTAGSASPTDATMTELRTALGLPVNIILAGSQAINVVAPTQVTGMTFNAVANTTYIVEVQGAFSSVATTTGIGLCLDVPTGALVSGHTYHPTSATAAGFATQTADAACGATSGVTAAGTVYSLTSQFVVRTGGTAGPINLFCRSEVAASAVTLQQNRTIMSYRVIN